MSATETAIRVARVTGYYNYAGLAQDVFADIGENITDCGSKAVLVIVGGYKMMRRWHNHPYRQEIESGIVDADFYINAYPSDTNSHLEPNVNDGPLGSVVAQIIEQVRKRSEKAVVLVLGFEDPIHVGVIVADVAKKCWSIQYPPQKGKEQTRARDDDLAVADMVAEGGHDVDD